MEKTKKYFFIFLTLGVFFHLLAVIFSEGFHRPDEHLGIIRFVALKLGFFSTTDLSSFSWEYPAEIRNWIQPGIYYIFAKLLTILNFKDPFIISMFLRLLSSTLGIISLIALVKISLSFIEKESIKRWMIIIFFTLWYLPFFHARTTAENFGISFFIFGIYPLLIHYPIKNSDIKSFYPQNYSLFHPPFLNALISGMFLALSVIFRIPMANMVFFFLIWLFLFGRLKPISIIPIGIGISISIVITFIFDWWGYGHPTLSIFNYLYQEFVNSVSHAFGIDPFYKYITKTFIKGAPPLSLIFLIPPIWLAFKKPTNIFAWITIPFFIVHSLIGHKELRYIFALGLFTPVILAIFLEHHYNFFKKRKWVRPLVVFLLVQNLCFLIVASLKPAHGPIKFYKHLYYKKEIINQIYTLNLIRDQLYFYQKNEIEFTHLKSKIDLSDKLKNINKVSWFLIDKLVDREIFNPYNNCHMDYSTYPKLAFKFNISNWMKRSKIWTLYRCERP